MHGRKESLAGADADGDFAHGVELAPELGAIAGDRRGTEQRPRQASRRRGVQAKGRADGALTALRALPPALGGPGSVRTAAGGAGQGERWAASHGSRTWFTSPWMAAMAARLRKAGAGQSGKPCPRLTAAAAGRQGCCQRRMRRCQVRAGARAPLASFASGVNSPHTVGASNPARRSAGANMVALPAAKRPAGESAVPRAAKAGGVPAPEVDMVREMGRGRKADRTAFMERVARAVVLR